MCAECCTKCNLENVVCNIKLTEIVLQVGQSLEFWPTCLTDFDTPAVDSSVRVSML